MTNYFICGIGTEVGKTYVTCLLSEFFYNKCKFNSIKPIVSGWNDKENNDLKLILNSMKLQYNTTNINKINLLRYKEPLSPHMIDKNIDIDQVLSFCNENIINNDLLFIEGAGGIMTPISYKYTMLDIMKELDIEVILVSNNYLGSINHTLLTVETLEKFNIKIHSIILNHYYNNDIPIHLLQETFNKMINYKVTNLYKNKNLSNNYFNFIYKTNICL